MLDASTIFAQLLMASQGLDLGRGLLGPQTWMGEMPPQHDRPWLGFMDLRALSAHRPDDAAAIAQWLDHVGYRCLAVRNLLLAAPWTEAPSFEPTEVMRASVEPSWFRGAQATLLLVPTTAPGAAPEPDFDALGRTGSVIVDATHADHVWARSFDASLAVTLGHLATPEGRDAFRRSLDSELRYVFDDLLPLAEANLLDALVGGLPDARAPRSLVVSLRDDFLDAAPDGPAASAWARLDSLSRAALVLRSGLERRPADWAGYRRCCRWVAEQLAVGVAAPALTPAGFDPAGFAPAEQAEAPEDFLDGWAPDGVRLHPDQRRVLWGALAGAPWRAL